MASRKLHAVLMVCIMYYFLLLCRRQLCFGSDMIKVPGDFETIQEAIDNAVEGSMILVSAGIYYEQLTIDKPLVLKGENKDTTVIDGSSNGVCIKITASNVTVAGFRIINALVGIIIQNCSGIRIVDNVILATKQESVILYHAHHNVIVNNTLQDNLEGIHLVFSNSNVIMQNKLEGNSNCGVLLDHSTDNLIKDNRASANHDTGIFLANSFSNIILNNSVTLSNDDGIVLQRSYNNLLKGNVVFGNYHSGIYLVGSANNVLNDNVWKDNCWHGIALYGSNYNEIMNNLVLGNKNVGVYLFCSGNNFLRDNILSENARNFRIYGETLQDFLNDVDGSNKVDGKTLYYWTNKQNIRVPEDAGYVAIVNSSNIMVNGVTINNNGQGILLAHTNNSCLTGIDTSKNLYGMEFFHAYNNYISLNTLANNVFGIFLRNSEKNSFCANTISSNIKGVVGNYANGNCFFHNNFINQTVQVTLVHSFGNVWDSGFEGNYWDSYSGVDNDGDGIGDAPFILDTWNCDRFPLMRPYVPGDVSRDCMVDDVDADLLRHAWLSIFGDANYIFCADFNVDFIVNVVDASFVGLFWQRRF